ncbi:DUF4332 domain-containing protein [Pleurocapsa sp. PCC 7319]|uniref:DUF4332 domain-containing protein n=1 Tax=Pleurocapsa sp. PCC 7319 TaxID=118161 RepID=UPI000347C675|nr:DUF4332 domain-containing protein [Pleurocapsa sp. PCC 7319]
MESRYWSIDRLPGLMLREQELLKRNNITDTKELLNQTSTPNSRLALANQLKMNLKQINKLVALADLARLPSVGYRYCGLLLHAGMISVTQVAQTPFHRLHRQIVRLQVATLQRKDLSPPVEEVRRWVEEARLLK